MTRDFSNEDREPDADTEPTWVLAVSEDIRVREELEVDIKVVAVTIDS